MNGKDRIKALIIDDEEPARSLIRYYLKNHGSIEVAGECSDGYCALLSIRELKPDLLFLDIQMPRITGFEMLEVLEEKPEIIFTTAYDEYAIRAFDINAVDYLLKPFPEKRFYEAVDKAIQRIRTGDRMSGKIKSLTTGTVEGSAPLSRIIIRKGSAISFISAGDIQYIQAEDDYVMIFHAGGKALKQQTMKYYEKQLPSKEFVRIHRSYIVAIEQISRVEPYGKDSHIAIMKDGKRLPVSRSGYKRLML